MEGCMAQPDAMREDEDCPAYTMGRAAEIVGCSPDFLRRLGEAKLFDPFRSGGGHRRYSRYQLRLLPTASTLATNCGLPPALARCATTAPTWQPRYGSSFSKTNSRKRCGSTARRI